VATSSGGVNFDLTPISPTPTTGSTWCFSVYLLAASGTPKVTAYFATGDLAQTVSREVTLSASRWTRVNLRLTIAPGSALTLIGALGPLIGAADFYATGFMLDRTSAWRGWAAPGSPHAGTSLAWPLGDVKPSDDLTIAFWLHKQGQSSASLFVLANSGSAEGLLLEWGAVLGVEKLSLSVITSAGESTARANFPANADWKHVACVMRQRPDEGQSHLEIWIDGSLAGSADALDGLTPTFDADDTAHPLGLSVSSSDSLIDDLVLFPWAAPAEELLAIAQSATAYETPPYVSVKGAHIGAAHGLRMAGSVGKSGSMQGRLEGRAFGLVQQVSFTVEER
jgi:hypothetical protein